MARKKMGARTFVRLNQDKRYNKKLVNEKDAETGRIEMTLCSESETNYHPYCQLESEGKRQVVPIAMTHMYPVL